jgi:hypothetical protein
MSFGISPVGKNYETPFALLTPSTSGVLFFDESTACSSVKTSSPLQLTTEGYCEAAFVHANTSTTGFYGYGETSHTSDYMRATVVNKSSRAGEGAFNAPKGDDLCLSFSTSHAWAVTGYLAFTPTISDTAKSHALLIMLR